MVVVVIIIVILACPDTRCESGQTSGSCGTIITTTNAIITARRCVLPGDLQGRSRQFYEDILHVISHFNIEFKGVAHFIPSWWYEDIWHVISHVNI